MVSIDLSPLFISALRESDEFEIAADIVRKNAHGKIWVIGGFVYRTLTERLYGRSSNVKDFDFVVEEAAQKGECS